MPLLTTGTRLGPYEILASLGQGAMGEVYKAHDTRLQRSVAVKVLPASLADDPDRRARFEREARAVAKLDHPHVCGIYDVGEALGMHYLVMPLLEGETLATRLDRGPLPIDLAMRIAIELADGLHAAHRLGVVHRDLKPANIFLVRRSGGSATVNAKLLDFGLAKLRASSGAISMSAMEQRATMQGTALGTIVGTVLYMSPEQVQGREADARSDLWALGVVIYEMLTGTRPFAGENPASVIGSILRDAPPPVSSRQPLTPAALDRVVATCLEKDPEDRWQTAADLKRQLEWTIGDTTGASAATVATRRRTLMPALPIAAAAAGALATWLLMRPDAAPLQSPNRPVVFTIEAPSGSNLVGPAASTSVPQVAVAPDGRRLVFVAADSQGQRHLWLRDLADPIARRLPGTEGATDPFWSSDSRRLGFLSLGVVKTIDTDAGSAPQMIGRGPVDSRGGAWNLDDAILFYAGRPGTISRILATGGPVTEITLVGANGMARWPEFLPDGRHVIYQVRDADPDRRGVYVSATDGSGTRRLVGTDWTAHYGSGYLLFLNGTTLMAQPFEPARVELSGTPAPLLRDVGGSGTAYGSFSVSATGVLAYTRGQFNRTELRWVNRAGTAMDLVAPEGDYVDVSLSPDESRVGYSRVDPQSQAPDIWVRDLRTGALSKITSERLVDASAVWSPDGNDLVFRSNRSSTIGVELYRTTASPGGPVDRILSLKDVGASSQRTNAIPTSWSRDGQILFYQATADAGYGIWATSVDRKDPKPILETRFNELQPALSADGRWMAYASDQSGQYEIYVQEFPTGMPRPISIGGGMQPQWRRDSRELYYLAPDGSLMHVAVNAGEMATAPKVLFKTLIPPVLNPYRMDYVPAADGQRFLMKVPLNREAPVITVVLNWPALLER